MLNLVIQFKIAHIFKIIKILKTARQTHTDPVHTGQHKESINVEIVYTATIEDVIKIVTNK